MGNAAFYCSFRFGASAALYGHTHKYIHEDFFFTSRTCHLFRLRPATISSKGGADECEFHLCPLESIDPLETDVVG